MTAKTTISLKYNGPETWTSRTKPGIDIKPKPVPLLPIWEKFAHLYTQNGQDKKKLAEINLLNEIAFGKGVEAVLAEHGLVDSHGKSEELKTFIKKIDRACKANSELTQTESKGFRPLNKAILHALITQWIALKAEHDCLTLKTRKRDKQSNAELSRKRDAILETAQGRVLNEAIHELCGSLIAAASAKAKARMNLNSSRIAEDEINAAAALIFRASLFAYDDPQRSSFITYLEKGLKSLVSNAINMHKFSFQTSLDYSGKDNEGLSLLDKIGNEKSADPLAKTLNTEQLGRMRELIETELTEKEAETIKLRFGLNGKPAMTMQEIADELGHQNSRNATKKLIESAISKLNAALLEEDQQTVNPSPPTKPITSKPAKQELHPDIITSQERRDEIPPSHPAIIPSKIDYSSENYVNRVRKSRARENGTANYESAKKKLGKIISNYRQNIKLTHKDVIGSFPIDLEKFSADLQQRWNRKKHGKGMPNYCNPQRISDIEKGIEVPSADIMQGIIELLREYGVLNHVQEQDIRRLHSEALREKEMRSKDQKSWATR